MPETEPDLPFSARIAAEALAAVLAAFRRDGTDIPWLYLIRAPFEYGMDEWVLRLVTEESPQAMWAKRVHLRRDGLMPALPVEARLDTVSPKDLEALCIADYAKNAESWPIILDDFIWKGLYFDYVLIAGIDVKPLKTPLAKTRRVQRRASNARPHRGKLSHGS